MFVIEDVKANHDDAASAGAVCIYTLLPLKRQFLEQNFSNVCSQQAQTDRNFMAERRGLRNQIVAKLSSSYFMKANLDK